MHLNQRKELPMGKALLVAAFAALVLLAFGTELAPNSPAFWLASSAAGYQIVRFALMLLLLMQIATDPPRHKTFRMISLGISSLVALWALRATYGNTMLFLDTLSLLASSVAVALTALERKVDLLPTPEPKRTATA
jgi:hypothetical protein